MYVYKLLCVNTCYCCPLCQPLHAMVMVNVMITNNPYPCITKCVMQGLSKMCRSGNGTLTLLSSLPPCLPAGNLLQRSVERVSFDKMPLHFVCKAVQFFGHVKELECADIRVSQEVCLCIA